MTERHGGAAMETNKGKPMEIKITNEEELAQANRDLQTFERYNLYPDTVRRIRTAIADYKRDNESARVAEIAAGLSDKAKERVLWINKRNDILDFVISEELESKGLESKEWVELTPLGLKVLAELQKPAPLRERWGVFQGGSSQMVCSCISQCDASTIATLLQSHFCISYTVRKI